MVTRPYRLIVTLMLVLMAGAGLIAGFYNWWHNQPPTLAEAFPLGEMRVGVDASFPPFAIDTGTDLFGLDIDLATAIGEEIGMPVRFVNMGYDGLYDSLISEQVDVVISALLINPVRMQDIRYTRPYFDNGLILVEEPDTEIIVMADLPGYAVAYEYGSVANSVVRQWQRRLDAFNNHPYELPEYALDAVRLDEADAALVNTTSYRLYRQQYPDWQAETHRVSNAFFAIAVSIRHEARWKWVDAALGTLQQDGRLQAIIDKWL